MNRSRTSRRVRRSCSFAVLILALASVTTLSSSAASRHHGDGRVIRSAVEKPRAALTATVRPDANSRTRLLAAYGQLPLTFEANRGQTDSSVDFLSRGSGYSVFLSGGEALVVLRAPGVTSEQDKQTGPTTSVRIKLVGRSLGASAVGRDRLAGTANYFMGNDPRRWRTKIPLYGDVLYEDVYPGIDVVYYGNQQQLEYDFVVAPGADPRTIRLAFEGADSIKVDARGDLVLRVGSRELRQSKPVIYQDVNGERRSVRGSYKLEGSRRVGFRVEAYDRGRPLIIDPTLVYSTLLGGIANDVGAGIAVDAAGHAYVTGIVTGGPSGFPTTSTFGAVTINDSVFVTKFNETGTAILYSTLIGGSGNDGGLDIIVDSSGSAYITGTVDHLSTDFPTTPSAFQPTHGGGTSEAFVAKLSADGSALLYSSFLGGSSGEGGRAIALDGLGSAYVTGVTGSNNFPTTPLAFQSNLAGFVDSFVTKVSADGSALVYSTYLGGSSQDEAHDLGLDSLGQAHVAGWTNSSDFPITPTAYDPTTVNQDAFVTKLNSTGSALVYSTFLGGNTGGDLAFGLTVDAAANAYVTGTTNSNDFPTTPGAVQPSRSGNLDAFVAKLNQTGSLLLYSTYLGGQNEDYGTSIAVDALENTYVVGATQSTDFPTERPFQSALAGNVDTFITKLGTTGFALTYSSYFGGNGKDVAFNVCCPTDPSIVVDGSGNAYVTGTTFSSDFPITPGAYQQSRLGPTDAFVAKIGDVAAPATLTLDPPAATNPVDAQHCVTATVRDAGGNPVPDVAVRFTVTGSVTTSGSATTDANGEATFCYQGPALPGADTITAFADTDNDGAQDVGEPSGAATKAWVLPVTTPLCEIKITNGGWIIAANGDRASFGGNAKADADRNTQGQEQYQDHGPFQPLNVHSINVLAIVCEGTTQASIYGQATINGAGSFTYRIQVRDLGEPGIGHDTYGILLGNGYTSGEQVLEGGNVQIHRE